MAGKQGDSEQARTSGGHWLNVGRVVALAACIGAGARAEGPEVNAALRYWSAWSQCFHGQQESVIGRIAKGVGDEGWTLAPADATALPAREDIDRLITAAMLERCDFDLDREAGPLLLLPHLSKMRATASLLAIDARHRLDAGDRDGAIEAISAGYRLAAHCATDRTLISSRTALGCFQTVDAVAALANERAAFLDAEKATLRSALERIDAADPLFWRAAWRDEGRRGAAFMRRSFATPEGTRAYFDVFDDVMSLDGRAAMPEGRGPVIARIGAEGGFDEAVRKYEQFYADADAAMAAEGADKRLDALGERVHDGAYGALTPFVASRASAIPPRLRESAAAVRAANERAAP